MTQFRRKRTVDVSGTLDTGIPGIGGTVPASTSVNLSDQFDNSNVDLVTYSEKEKIEKERIANVENLPDLKIISSVVSVYSEAEIQRISVVDLTNPDISSPRYPVPKSLYDTNMGTIVSDRKCGTCQIVNCLGHFGRIPFASPIPHPMWLTVIRDILTSVCNSCGTLLVPQEVIVHNGWNLLPAQKRISAIAANAATSRKGECPNSKKCPDIKNGKVTKCRPNPKFKTPKAEEGFNIIEEIKIDGNTKPSDIKVEKILSIFKCISDEDAKLMGFNYDSRPENLIMQSLMVIPPAYRPPFVADGRNNPDDLTDEYRKIIICANELRLAPDDPTIKFNLYFKVKVLMEGKKQKYKNVKKFMSITNRLQGKQAVPRASLMGKRTNMCARTVISPDTSLSFGQVRIPYEWAPLLTVPQKVTALNIDATRELIENGKVSDIEVITVNEEGKSKFYRKAVTKDTTVKIGDKIYRHLRDGDLVVINRQPTLHKLSMLAFDVKLGKERTVGLHLTYTTPFNADFDGDEMNIWVPESVEAIEEARSILHASKNVMSSAKNKINMGLIYDAITASFLLTREHTVDEGLYYDLKGIVADSEDLVDLDERLLKHKVHPRSGNGVFSMVLPRDLNYFKGNVIIMDGVLIKGRITAEHVGPTSKSIVEVIYMQHGVDRYSEFITKASFLVLKYISEVGHTVGISDCMAIDSDKRKRELEENEKAFDIIQSKIDALGEVPRDEIAQQLYENKVKDILMSSAEMGFSLIKENISDINNNIGAMIAKIGAGAKGKVFNIQQIRGRLGQQYRKGERLPLSCGGRILPGFDQNDLDIRARGYIKSNFMKGLSPEEHFLHMMAAREGLIDTAVNVAVMGDIHRRIVKALENIYVGHNGAVINSSHAVFQLILGGDGFDPSRLVMIKKTGSDADPVATFADMFQIAKDLNVKSGWVSKKTAELAILNSYIIEVIFTWEENGSEVNLNNVSSRDVSSMLYNHFGSDPLLQEVTVISEGTNKARFYYKLSENNDLRIKEIQEKFTLESEFQLETFELMKGQIIRIKDKDPRINFIVRSAEITQKPF